MSCLCLRVCADRKAEIITCHKRRKQALSACTHIERTNAPINNGLNEHRALIERARLQDFRSIMSLADPATLVDPLEKIFNDLKNKNPEVRLQSAQDLRRHVRAFSRLRKSTLC